MNRSKPKPRPTETAAPEARPQGRGQFSLASMMLWMVIFSVVAAIFGRLMQSDTPRPIFVLLVVVAPVAVLLVFGIFDKIRRHRPRRRDDD